jgi:hypothetical protein
VQVALTRQGVPPTSTDANGFQIEDGPGDSTIVQWGRGEPFRAVRVIRRDDGLLRCSTALRREGFHSTVEETVATASVYLLVSQPPAAATPSLERTNLPVGDGGRPTSESASSMDALAPQRTWGDERGVGKAEHRTD